MAWLDEMTLMLRHVIDDVDLPYTYTDPRLEETVLVAAQFAIIEMSFDKTYVVDVDGLTLTPDPTASVRDNGFISLVTLKAACLILKAEAKIAANTSFKIVDGPSQIDTTSQALHVQKRADKMCEDYEDAKMRYQAGNSRAGAAILSSYVRDNSGTIPWNF